MFDRRLSLPTPGEATFFLWGPRQTGKSTLLRVTYPAAPRIDLLQSDTFHRYLQQPSLLREEVHKTAPPFVIIDEIQKLPVLLDEVHWLHENYGTRFALCGSSARKVRHGHANLLGGRALRFELHGLVSVELGDAFDLQQVLNQGYLAGIFGRRHHRKLLRSYVADYLKEEIVAEGLTRNLPSFSEFLTVAALDDTGVVNFSNIARECAVSPPTVRNYYEILVDTLLGRFLPAFRFRPKRRVQAAAKFYFADVGVVNALARRGEVQPRTEVFGKAFENWVFHELAAYLDYADRDDEISYWRLSSGSEVDFVVGRAKLAIEVKGTALVKPHHLRALQQFKQEYPSCNRRIVVSLDAAPRKTNDGIEILPATYFARALWNGELF